MEGRRTADEPGPVLRAEGDLDGARHMFEASLRISRRNGDSRGMAYDCLYLACLAGDMGDWDRAGVLHGFAQVFQDRAGIPRDEFDERYRQDSLAQAHARMGDEPLERACARGMAFSLEKAFDLATAAAEPGPGAAPPLPSVNAVRSHLERVRDKAGARRPSRTGPLRHPGWHRLGRPPA
jgi:hypothetical protein